MHFLTYLLDLLDKLPFGVNRNNGRWLKMNWRRWNWLSNYLLSYVTRRWTSSSHRIRKDIYRLLLLLHELVWLHDGCRCVGLAPQRVFIYLWFTQFMKAFLNHVHSKLFGSISLDYKCHYKLFNNYLCLIHEHIYLMQ